MRKTVMRDPDRRGKRRAIGAGAAAIGTSVIAIGLYHHGASFVTERSDQPPAAAAPSSEPAPTGLYKLSFLDAPRRVPELRFVDGQDHALSLGDFRGRPIVLNIWATWCVPCREEMPALDRLQSGFDRSRLLVLPLSIDRQGVPVVRQFYQELHIKALGVYVDQSGRATSELATVGVPTTLLIDRDGREVGRKIGLAEWDSPEMVGLIRAHLGLQPDGAKGKP
jgi:thiol-disulfide isomerase/thioredoxin